MISACISIETSSVKRLSITAIHFTVVISGKHLKQSRPQGHCVYFTTQQLFQPPVVTSGPWLIWENMKGTVLIWGRPVKPSSVKSAYSLHRTEWTIFVRKILC